MVNVSTQVSDVIVPKVFASYKQQHTTEKTRMFKGRVPAAPAPKSPRAAHAVGVENATNKASAQGSLQHKRAHMHKDKARLK